MTMGLYIKDSGKMVRGLGMEYKFGQMERNTRVIGGTTRPMERVNSITPRETYSTANG